MKKVLLSLLVAGFCTAVNAATVTPATLTLSGDLNSTCAGTLGTSNLGFTFIPGTQSSTASTTYTLTCTAGSVISTFTATSANGWQFLETNSGDLISYTVPVTTAAPYTAAVSTMWSGASGSTTPEDLLASGSITINGSAAPIVSTLVITPGTTPAASNVGTYSDTITMAASY